MADGTGISWTDATWSPLLGCSPASAACANCYARRDVWRMAHNPNPKIAGPRQGLVEKTAAGELRWTGKVALLPDQLRLPLTWRKPRRIFPGNQSDLFHPAVPDDFLLSMFSVMAEAAHHTFQIVTKRAARMRHFMQRHLGKGPALRNVWLGVTVEDQRTADERIPELVATPARSWRSPRAPRPRRRPQRPRRRARRTDPMPLVIRLLNSLQEYELDEPGNLHLRAREIAEKGFWRNTKQGEVFHPWHTIGAIRVVPPKTRRRQPAIPIKEE